MNNNALIKDFIRFLGLHDIGKERQKKYRYHLNKIVQIIPNKTLDQLNKTDIEELVTKIDDSKLAEWTKHDYRVAIKKFFTWFHNKDNEDLDEWENPKIIKWLKIKRPKVAKKLPSELLTPQDIQFLVENSRGLREKALLLTLYESGARIGELRNLKIKDVVFDDFGCLVNLFGKTGYRKVRLIGSTPAISQWLELQHPKKDDLNSYLFCNTHKKNIGGKLSYQSIRDVLQRLKRRTGFKKPLNPHIFRHSRATELSEHLTDAQRCNFFGWIQGSQVCRVYTHLQDTDRAILELNGLVEKDKNKDGRFKNIICPRCKFSNPYGSEICKNCSMGLDIKSIEKYEDKQRLINKFLDPEELDRYLGEKMLKIAKELELQIK